MDDFVVFLKAVYCEHQVAFKWYVPFIAIATIETLALHVVSLVSGRDELARPTHLLFYHDSHTLFTYTDRAIADQCKSRFEIIGEIVDIGEEINDGLFFRIKWVSLPDDPDLT